MMKISFVFMYTKLVARASTLLLQTGIRIKE